MALQPDYIYTIYGLVIAVCSVSALIFFSKLVIKRQYKKSFTWLSVPWWEREEFSGLNPHNYDLWFRQHTGNGLLGLDEHLLGKLSGKELEAVFRLQVKGGRHSYRIKVFRGDGTAVANIGPSRMELSGLPSAELGNKWLYQPPTLIFGNKKYEQSLLTTNSFRRYFRDCASEVRIGSEVACRKKFFPDISSTAVVMRKDLDEDESLVLLLWLMF